MNRKGFAVTAVIYGLSILGVLIISILMGTLSSSRNNVKEEAKQIERELIAFNKTSVIFSSGQNEFTVPEGESGWYRVEAFGAGKGLVSTPGAYTTGIIHLSENQSLFVSIGANETQDTIIYAGRNGGPRIMMAAASYGTQPGGTLKSYSSEPLGGNIDLADFRLNKKTTNLIGTEAVTYSDGYAKSEIAGYPGSTSAQNFEGSSYYFVDGLMVAGANPGPGKVLITRLTREDDSTPTIPRINKKFDNVNAIKIHNGSGVGITGIYANCNGNPVLQSGVHNEQDMSLSLSTTCNVDDISILFDTTGNKYVTNVTVDLQKGGNLSRVYSASGATQGFTPTPTGIKLSAYQLDYLQSPPSYGNYYLIPVTVPNKVVSAKRTSESEDNPIDIDYLAGAPRQKWSISKITSINVLDNPNDIEYYISEQSRYKAIAIYHDDNVAKNRIFASMTFNTLSRNPPQIWKIYPQGDGTYAIKTVVRSYNESHRSGFITVNTSRKDGGGTSDYYGYLMLGYAENDTYPDDEGLVPTIAERFILYNLDFGTIYK